MSIIPKILPMGLLEKCIGQRVLVIMKDEKEFIGILNGYNEFFRIILYNNINRHGFRKCN